MWSAGGAGQHPQDGGAAAAAGPLPPPALEPGSLRLQFAGGRRLGGCLAWDRASGLLAVELQADEDAAGSSSIPVAIVDPQEPESHFIAHVPASPPGERLAALAWSPPAARRLLLAVTASGQCCCWGMEDPAAPQGTQVLCLNQWFGWRTLQLPLAAADGAAAATESLLAVRFLEPPGAEGAAWDPTRAPPFADRPLTTSEVVSHYQRMGLEQAFCPTKAPPPAGPADEPPQGLPALHWLRPGLLCVAAVTSHGRLLLALSGRSVSGDGESVSAPGGAWALLPPVQLPLVAPPLSLAAVSASAGGALLVAAAAPQSSLLFEVSGLQQTVAAAAAAAAEGDTSGGSAAHAPPPQVASVPLPAAAAPAGAATVALEFLSAAPAGAAAGCRLLLVSSHAGGTAASVVSLAGGAGGLPYWQARASQPAVLSSQQLPAAAVAATPDAASLAVLLPAARQLLCLSAGHLGQSRAPMRTPAAAAAAAGAGAAEQQAAAVACSPQGLYAAVAARGASALVLLPLLEQPAAAGVEHCMLELGKRCCYALLSRASSSGGPSWWDLKAYSSSVCARWGHQHLQTAQELVDGAVLASRGDARPAYVACWSRLKCGLLAAAAAAQPSAAADCASACVRADTAAREWMAAAAAALECHVPDRTALVTAASKGPANFAGEVRAMASKALPARYWALWTAEFGGYLTRCLLYWIRRQQAPHPAAATPPAQAGDSAEAAAAAAAARFAAEHNASVDCLPCIRLLSDGAFYRTFGRAIQGVSQLVRVLTSAMRGKAPNQFQSLLKQLEVLSDMAVLIRFLHDAYKRNGGSSTAAGSGGSPVSAAGAGYSGAWTLVSPPPAPAVTWHQVSGALAQLKEQPGGSMLLSRVRALWAEQGLSNGRAESADTLLQAAAKLGLVPARPAAGASAGIGGASPAPSTPAGGGSRLAALLQERTVALAAAEAGESVGDGPALPPLLPPPGALTDGWLDWDTAASSGGAAAMGAAQGKQAAAAAAAGERQWEAERDAALGLPPAPPAANTPAAYVGKMDVLVGRLLYWEHAASYATADGSCATAELHPDQLGPGGAGGGWQAAYTAAAPVGGQPWKRLRVA